jgi:hypothetical protein
VRKENYIAELREARCQLGFVLIHVQACARDLARPKSLDEGFFIHHGSARRIYQESGRLH